MNFIKSTVNHIKKLGLFFKTLFNNMGKLDIFFAGFSFVNLIFSIMLLNPVTIFMWLYLVIESILSPTYWSNNLYRKITFVITGVLILIFFIALLSFIV